MSQLIVIEGIDGSGKGTQSRLLTERLQNTGHTAELISFPRYEDTFFGRAIGDFLNGRFGSLDAVNPYLVSLLYAGDRFESRDILETALKNNKIVVLDRYIASSLAHQGAKVPETELPEMINWIQKIELEIYQLPRPQLTLLLDLPATAAQKLIAQKAARSYTDQAADLQEEDATYLSNVRRAYQRLAAQLPNWRTITCASESETRSIDEIAEEIWRIVNQNI